VLNIITAFEAEAVPFIEGFSLRHESISSQHSIFTGAEIRLGVSGMGYKNSYGMTNYFLSKSGSAPTNWLNFGIAGSAGSEIGDLVLAQTVTHQTSNRTWNLDDHNQIALARINVCSVVAPQKIFPDNDVYDMEAAGMVSALAEHKMLNNVFVVKLISDGPDNPVNNLSKKNIRHLIQSAKSDILEVVQQIYSP